MPDEMHRPDDRKLSAQPRLDPVRRVPLLPRRSPVAFQHLVNVFLYRSQFRTFLFVFFSLRRDRTRR